MKNIDTSAKINYLRRVQSLTLQLVFFQVVLSGMIFTNHLYSAWNKKNAVVQAYDEKFLINFSYM